MGVLEQIRCRYKVKQSTIVERSGRSRSSISRLMQRALHRITVGDILDVAAGMSCSPVELFAEMMRLSPTEHGATPAEDSP